MKAKPLYYKVIDLSKPVEHPSSMIFGTMSCLCDFAGPVIDLARSNASKPEDIRLYFFETKKAWETAREMQANRICNSTERP